MRRSRLVTSAIRGLRRYFYTFDGDQGDIFINVVTKNFTATLMSLRAEGLRPLTKMVIYADAGKAKPDG